MRVLITGANGFIGRQVMLELARQNIECITVSRDNRLNFGGVFIQGDLLQKNSHHEIIKKANATHLIHLAWYAEHGSYWNSFKNIHWMDCSINLIKEFCRAGGEFVAVAGTSAEYGLSSGYLAEDDPNLKPNTLYGVCKDATRRVVSSVCDLHSTRLVWTRIFIPYGPEEDPRRLIPSLHRVFQHKQNPFGVNAASYRDFIHVKDVASAYLELIRSEAGGVFNISSGRSTLIADIVRSIAALYNGDPDLILQLNTERPAESEIIVGNNKKLKSIGWFPRHNLLENL